MKFLTHLKKFLLKIFIIFSGDGSGNARGQHQERQLKQTVVEDWTSDNEEPNLQESVVQQQQQRATLNNTTTAGSVFFMLYFTEKKFRIDSFFTFRKEFFIFTEYYFLKLTLTSPFSISFSSLSK